MSTQPTAAPQVDTIAAIATATGAGAIAIVRVSGPLARTVAQQVFRGSALRSHHLTLGTLLDAQGLAMDQGMAVLMAAPRSYTREDVLELHCHGGAFLARAVLDSCLHAGARPAQPGEFTQRAYMNGRIDLSQAQAVMDLIASSGAASARAALRRLEGGLSRRVQDITDALLSQGAALTALIEYPDEDLDEITATQVAQQLAPVQEALAQALALSAAGRKVAHGVQVAIVGAPNAGKSSLLNALLDSERAIVAHLPGTTRDTLTERIDMDGIAFALTDTAGLRDEAGEVERMGIERARHCVRTADLLIICVDSTAPLPAESAALLGDARALAWLNKADLAPRLSALDLAPCETIVGSASTGDNLPALRKALLRRAQLEHGEEALIWHEQDVAAATQALDALSRAQEALSTLTLDCALLDIQDALTALHSITQGDDDALLRRVFANFCLGK